MFKFTHRPRVSVVIPSYNHEKYVAEAIQSVLDQTFQDFEIIVTDDCSSDKTVEEIKKFKDPRIKLFCFEKNQGAPVAVNNCIKKSKGEYIANLSSDDVFLPDKLEKQVKFLDEHKKIGAVFGYAKIIDDEGNELVDKSNYYCNIFKQSNRTRAEWLKYFFENGNCLCHPSMLIRSECYDNVGLYDPRFAQLPDLDMWIRVCLKYEIFLMPEELIKFRARSSSANMSGDKPESQGRGAWEFSRILRHYLSIKSIKFLLNVFPEIIKIEKHPVDDLIKYYISLLALKNTAKSHKIFAIDVLYNLLSDKKIVKKLVPRFTYADFIEITKKYDPLNVAALIEIQAEINLLRNKL